MTIKETKAQRIFRQNFYGAIKHIETWGFEDFDAWHRLANSDDEYICRRTVNAVLSECDKKEKELDWNLRHGFENYKDAETRKALQVVRNTCNNWIKDEKELKEKLKAIF